MSPNKGETAVHGCHCPGNMVVRMRTVLAIPRGWYVCLSADKCCLQFILSTQVCKWSNLHTHCRGRTVLRFPTNSYHLPTVELALKGVLCTHRGSKGSPIRGFTSAPWPDGYAMLMSPNKGETAVHGCHCPGDMVVRKRTVLAIPRGWHVCFSADKCC